MDKPTHDEEITETLQQVSVSHTLYREDENRFIIAITPAIKHTGYDKVFEEYGGNISLRLRPDAGIDGMVPAIFYVDESVEQSDDDVGILDGRASDKWRSVIAQGEQEYLGYRISLPTSALEYLGIDPEVIKDNPHGYPIPLFAGDRMIALGRPRARRVEVSSDVSLKSLLPPTQWMDYKAIELDGKNPDDWAEERELTRNEGFWNDDGGDGSKYDGKYHVMQNVRRVKEEIQQLQNAGVAPQIQPTEGTSQTESTPTQRTVTTDENFDWDEDTVRVEEVGQYQIQNKGQNRLQITDAAVVAGVTPENINTASLYFQPENEINGVVPSTLYTGSLGQYGKSGWRSVVRSAGDGFGIRVNVPDVVLEAMEIPADDAAGEEISLYAGNRVVAFGKPSTREVSVELEPMIDLFQTDAVRYYREVVVNDRNPETVAEENGVQEQTVNSRVRKIKSNIDSSDFSIV